MQKATIRRGDNEVERRTGCAPLPVPALEVQRAAPAGGGLQNRNWDLQAAHTHTQGPTAIIWLHRSNDTLS